jgi:hypothetical protein
MFVDRGEPDDHAKWLNKTEPESLNKDGKFEMKQPPVLILAGNAQRAWDLVKSVPIPVLLLLLLFLFR